MLYLTSYLIATMIYTLIEILVNRMKVDRIRTKYKIVEFCDLYVVFHKEIIKKRLTVAQKDVFVNILTFIKYYF